MGPHRFEGRNGIDASVLEALNRFARALNLAYDGRVRRLMVFGSRARGEAAPDSDIDVAVVLDRMSGRRYDERMRMTDLAYEILLDTGLRIQAWPISRAEWGRRGTSSEPDAARQHQTRRRGDRSPGCSLIS